MTGNGAGAATAGREAAAARAATGGPPPVLLASLGAASISASAVLVKLANTGVATVAFYRCLLALPLLAALAILEQRRRGPRPPRARLGALAAGVFLAIDLVLWNHAIADVGAGIATVLGNLQVVFVTAAAWLAFRERPGRGFFLALPVVLALASQTAGWLLITSSLPRLPAALSSLLLLLQPAAAILLAAVVLSERPTVLQLAGAALVCAGVLAASRAATRRGLQRDPVGDDRGPGRSSRWAQPQARRARRERA